MQTIPGLVPVLQVGSFEGGQFSANGQATTNNLFLVDGQNDNDSRRGGSQGTQARVVARLDGRIPGADAPVRRRIRRLDRRRRQQRDQERHATSFNGRVFEYYQDNSLQATDYFLKQAGEENPDSGSNVFGGSIGGPIVQEQGVLLLQLRRDAREGGRQPELPRIGARRWRRRTRRPRRSPDRTRSCASTITSTGTTRSASAGPARRSSRSATRSRTTRAFSTTPRTRTMRATRLQRVVDVGAEQSRRPTS